MDLRRLRGADYASTVQAMRDFTAQRDATTPDELWLCEHPPVFTQGIAGRDAHVKTPGTIPVVRSDRGGQVTYHGPGQVVAYPLVDLARLGLRAREYVYRLEQALLMTLEGYGITGHRVTGAPGIYVRLADPHGHAVLDAARDPRDPWRGLGKIAALGVKIARRGAYHGVALNVAMDLQPFARIDPCGYAGLRTIDLSTIGVATTWDDAAERLAAALNRALTPR